jgi:hypothetical protein
MNRMKLWSLNEESKLLEELNFGYTLTDIAEHHQRTLGGITARIDKIAYDLYKQGMDIEMISKKTKLSLSSINNLIEKKEKPSELQELKEMVKTLIKNQAELISIISNLSIKN